MKYLIFDIETVPNVGLPKELIPQFDPLEVKTGNLKDPEKIKEKIHAEREEFENGLIKKMSVNTNLNRVLSIAWILFDDMKPDQPTDGCLVDMEGDKEILKTFLKGYDHTTMKLVGWNSKGFDIPTIRKRMLFHKIDHAGFQIEHYNELTAPYRNGSIDLMLDWDREHFTKLNDAALYLGVGMKQDTGADIYEYYRTGNKEKIIEHNVSDVELTFKVFKRLYGFGGNNE